MAALCQRRYAPLPDWKQALLILAVSEGFAAGENKETMEDFESSLYVWMETYEPQIPERLKTGAKLNGEEMDRVKEALTRFVREARHGDAD